MTVAVVIVARGRHRHLARVLGALRAQTLPADEVVVVDIESTPPLDDIVDRARCADARCIRIDADAGGSLPLARARNTGGSSTSASDLVFLDVDCIPARDLVDAYVDGLRQRPVALVCGPVRYLKEGWDADREAARLDAVLERRSQPHVHRPAPPERGVRIADDHEMFWSLSFAVRRATWTRLGGFDEGYVGYGAEDTDLGLRAKTLGIPMAWSATGWAFHQWHPATRLDPERTGEIVANARRFHDRWGWWPMRGWLDELSELGMIIFDPANDLLDC